MENFHYLDNEIMSMVVVAQGMNTEEKTTEMEILTHKVTRLPPLQLQGPQAAPLDPRLSCPLGAGASGWGAMALLTLQNKPHQACPPAQGAQRTACWEKRQPHTSSSNAWHSCLGSEP